MRTTTERIQKKRILSVLGAAIICLLAGLWMIQPSYADGRRSEES